MTTHSPQYLKSGWWEISDLLCLALPYASTCTHQMLNPDGFFWVSNSHLILNPQNVKGQQTSREQDVYMFRSPAAAKLVRKINFHKSIPLPLWAVHRSTPLLNPPWNRRRNCCLRRTMRFYYGQDAQFIFNISCSTTVQNMHKPTNNSTFSSRCRWALHLLLFYYLMLYHKITNKYCYQTFSAIIYHHPKLKWVASVASEVLERAKPSLYSLQWRPKILTLFTQMVSDPLNSTA